MSRTTFYQKNFIGWPPVLINEYNDPDSLHWENRTQEIKQLLILKMGGDAFLEWADRLFPGDSIDEATWKQIFDLYEVKFRLIQSECSCLPDLPDGRSRGHCLCHTEHKDIYIGGE